MATKDQIKKMQVSPKKNTVEDLTMTVQKPINSNNIYNKTIFTPSKGNKCFRFIIKSRSLRRATIIKIAPFFTVLI